MLTHLPKAGTLFKKTVSSQKKVTNARWNAESNLFSLLYSLVCSSKPKTIIETGVANGISTNAIMKGLELSNNIGVLHSFDVLPQTSNAYKGAGNWQFHLLSERSTHKHLKRIVSKLPQVDIWLHDSNHGYRWQKFEFLLAWGRLKKGGFLISDDVDASPAWAELSETVFGNPIYYLILENLSELPLSRKLWAKAKAIAQLSVLKYVYASKNLFKIKFSYCY